jgi:hypothetical protein
MSNGEIAAVVREMFVDTAVDAFDLVTVEVQDRRVFLRGEIPSEAHRDIATVTVLTGAQVDPPYGSRKRGKGNPACSPVKSLWGLGT